MPAPWRALGGLALVGLALILGLGYIGASGSGGLLSLALLLVLGGGAAAIIAVPLLIAGLARSDRARLTNAREDERRRVAAHLHDSVLQTLALVQRQAHDPAAVRGSRAGRSTSCAPGWRARSSSARRRWAPRCARRSPKWRTIMMRRSS